MTDRTDYEQALYAEAAVVCRHCQSPLHLCDCGAYGGTPHWIGKNSRWCHNPSGPNRLHAPKETPR